jgi:predicted phage baseplate assembly protein
LNSSGEKKEFVVEVERDGVAWLRFGDDRFGSRPAAGVAFLATYRTGNGSQGNVGAGSLAHIVTGDPAIAGDLSNPVIVAVGNPMPAEGGVEPETIEEVRQSAPSAFRTQERAVTPADYAARARSCDPGIQRAAATIRHTGSWRTVFVSVDRAGNAGVDSDFERALLLCLDRYRMAGQDVEVDGPRFVSLDLELKVCVKPEYFRSDVRAAILQRFSSRLLPDGSKGVFHPDNFTFGQPVYLSRIYEAAQSVPGVSSVDVTRFERQGVPGEEGIDLGRLDMERLEIARLDNDPNFPERGVFSLVLEGGR